MSSTYNPYDDFIHSHPIKWVEASRIKKYPKLGSTSLDLVKLLVMVKGNDTPVFGFWFHQMDVWRIEGSPSKWEITHFAILTLPKVPPRLSRNAF